VSTFYTDEDRAAGVPADNLAKAAEEGCVEDEGWRVCADGSRFWANVTITAIRDDDGALDGYARVTRDMTDRREQERQLRRERDLTDRIVDTSPVGIMVLDSDGNHVRINERAKDVLGIPDDQADSYSPSQRTVYDADGNLVALEEHPAARALASGEPVFDWEAKVELPDGGNRWLSVNAAPVFDASGAIEGVITTGEDITRLKSQAQRLERQRDDLESELEAVFERVDDGFFALDDDRRFTYVNERAGEFLERGPADLRGTYIWDALEPGPKAAEAFEKALETQQSVTFEEFYEPIDTWFENHVYPSEEGLSVYFRDVTERKKRERELQRYETIVETIRDGIYVVDEDGFFTQVNDAYLSMTGFERAELVGEHVSTVVDEETLDRASDVESALADGDRTTASLEAELTRPNGETWTGEATFSIMGSDDGSERIGVVRDVTERVERERTLEEYRRWNQTLVENFPVGAVALVDDDLRYVTFGGTPEGDADVSRDDLEGRSVRDVLPTQIAEVVVPRYQAALDGEAATFEDSIDGRTYEFTFVPVRDDDGDVFAVTAMSQDITDRKERERYLEDAKSRLEAATEAGAVGTFEWHVQDDEMVAGPSLADTFGVDLDAARDGVSLDRFIEAIHEDDREHVRESIETALESCGEYEEEYRVRNADGELRWVVARGRVECDDGDPVTFPGALTDITERKAAEIELVAQRERLAALNELNGVVREITGAVIDQSSREEIEAIVCDRLADSDSYLFAWIGDRDVTTETVDLRAEAGVEGYLDDITIAVGPDDERSEGPTGRALRLGTTQTTQDIRADSRYDPWRGKIQEYGFRSSAAIPIVHENTTYGVLNVYAERPNAFEGKERDVVDQLGKIVGHAIAAIERKRALLTDEVVELQFQIDDVFESLGIDAAGTEPIRLEQTVPIADDDYVFFGRTTPDGVETVEAMVEEIPFYETVTFRDDGDETVFELRVSEPPLLSVIASLGGSVPEAVIEDGDYRLTAHLPPSGDAREVIDNVQEVYPDANLLKRRQRSIRDHGEPAVPDLMSALTPRQRSALQTAFHAGFFEWPRESSGEEVASLLDVSPPTFHQHLRKAERKVLESVLASATSA
jgi:PAS domain S-box-containing protein